MLIQTPYNRNAVIQYAEKWAMSRNPQFPNFDGMGGDCTSFASQCIYAGCKVMNYTPVYGWFCNHYDSRSPSWSSVEYLYQFLMNNQSVGPYATEMEIDNLVPGDFIQLCNVDGAFYHTLVVLYKDSSNIYVAAHTIDSLYRPLSTYGFAATRGLHIDGARKWA